MTFPTILQRLGLVACIALIVSCFMPWGYYADIKETFTGLYSYNNNYGKPGKFLIFFAVAAFVLMYLPKVWAKRTNLFLCAVTVGYAIKTYILFTSCYNAYCPEKRGGIFLMLFSTVVMLIAAFFPDLKIKDKKNHVPLT
jgi:hypothetical protein